MLIGIIRNSKKEGQELIRIGNVSGNYLGEEIPDALTGHIDREVDEIMMELKDCLNDDNDDDGRIEQVIVDVQETIYEIVRDKYEVIDNAGSIIEGLNSKEIVSNRYAITDDNRIYDRDTCFEVDY
jgi:hypothetical protein